MALPCKKLYVDTAFKTPDSRSNSDFRFELPESLTFGENTGFYICDVGIPHSWYTIEPGLNDRFYFQAQYTGFVLTGYQVQLASQVYTGADLAAELQTKMNASAPGPIATPFAVAFDAATNLITITPSADVVELVVLTSGDLATQRNGHWFGPAYDARNPKDINGEMLKQTEGVGAIHDSANPWVSGVLSLQPVRTIYLYSPNLGSYHTIGPNGERSILKSIPVSAGPGFMIFDQVLSGNDYLDCSRQTLRTLEFQLRDHRGNLIPFHGSNLSFSLIFDTMDVRS